VHKERSRRPQTATTLATSALVLQQFTRSPQKSVKQLLPTTRWRSTPLPSRCQDVSGWNSTWSMDRSKRCCWVSTTVPGSNTSRLLPMRVPKGWCLSEETSYTGWSTRKHCNVVCSYHAGHITERSSCSSLAASTVFGCWWWPLGTPTLNPKFKDISHINFAFV